MANYTVFDHGQVRQGDARSILETIREQAASDNDEIAAMDVDSYAAALLEDAPYFLEDDLLTALKSQQFDSKFDEALTYLAQMPTSGVRILTASNGRTAQPRT